MTVTSGMLRLNIGCGEYRMPGWINVDSDQRSAADLVLTVPPLPWPAGSIAEIYAGHYLEHLDRDEGARFLSECFLALEPGGKLGILVPDMAEVFRRYIVNEPAPMEWPAGTRRDLRDLDELCTAILFSTEQPSHHRWAYDLATLKRALERAGFLVLGEIDRFHDPRVAVGAWYQCGWNAVKPL